MHPCAGHDGQAPDATNHENEHWSSMSRHTRPYKGASLVPGCSFSCTNPFDGIHHGTPVLIELYTDYASAGFRTNYTRVPKAWLVMEFGSPTQYHCFAYSGKRYEMARKDFDARVAEVQAELVKQFTTAKS